MLRKSNKSIKKVTIHFLKPMVLSNLKSPPQGPPPSQDSTWPSWGDHVAGDRKDPLRFR